jgi:hypothetical protein
MLVVADADIQLIDAHARQRHDAFGLDISQAADAHADRFAGSGGQVFDQRRFQARRVGERVWFSELRYSLNDFDSMMFGESAGMLNSPMATTGLPDGSSQDSSKQFQKSTPLYGRVSPLRPSSAHFAARGIGNSSDGV